MDKYDYRGHVLQDAVMLLFLDHAGLTSTTTQPARPLQNAPHSPQIALFSLPQPPHIGFLSRLYSRPSQIYLVNLILIALSLNVVPPRISMLVSVLFNDKRRPAIEDSLLAADFWLYPSPSWYYQSRAKPLRGKSLASSPTNASRSILLLAKLYMFLQLGVDYSGPSHPVKSLSPSPHLSSPWTLPLSLHGLSISSRSFHLAFVIFL